MNAEWPTTRVHNVRSTAATRLSLAVIRPACMRCNIYMTPDNDRPSDGRGTSDFAALFGRILHEFRDRYWVVGASGSAWNWPENWLLDGTADRLGEESEHGDSVSGRFMLRHADMISDFDLDLSLLSAGHQHANSPTDYYSIGRGTPMKFPANAEIAFHNLDAAYWAILWGGQNPLDDVLPNWRHTIEIIPEKIKNRG